MRNIIAVSLVQLTYSLRFRLRLPAQPDSGLASKLRGTILQSGITFLLKHLHLIYMFADSIAPSK